MERQKKISFKKVKTYSLSKRESKVTINSFAKPYKKNDSFKDFINKLPDVLAVKDLKNISISIVKARENGKHVILGMGAHPIKVGLSPIIIDLIKRNIITAIATNGAGIIHDFEIAFVGHTSEDVEKELSEGMFGMAQETGRYLNKAIKYGATKNIGIGKAVGEMIYKENFQFKDLSIFATAYTNNIPATVHVAIGTDIIHMHPDADGSAIGKGSYIDFKIFTSLISELEGGVYINLGSAVIMPEVFLKALNISRNLGFKVDSFTTINMDFIQHYRPVVNVLKRPVKHTGFSYAITGHHELMLPLLSASIIEALS